MRYTYKIDIHGYIVGYLKTDQPLEYDDRTWSNDKLVLHIEDGVTVQSAMPVQDVPKTPGKDSK
jgi:hypothetical protein